MFCVFLNNSKEQRFIYQYSGPLEDLANHVVVKPRLPAETPVYPEKAKVQAEETEQAGDRIIKGKMEKLTRPKLQPIPLNQLDKITSSRQIAVATNALIWLAKISPRRRAVLQTFMNLEPDVKTVLIGDIFMATRLFLLMIRANLRQYKDLLDSKQLSDFRRVQNRLKTNGLVYPSYEEAAVWVRQLGKTQAGQSQLLATYTEGVNIFTLSSDGIIDNPPEAIIQLSRKEKPTQNRFRVTESPQSKKYPDKFFLEGRVVEKEGYPTIALTFDDGPDSKYTPQILKILAKENVKATFYLQGMFIRTHPDVVRQIASRGHEIALHSYDHKNLHRIPDPKKAYVEQALRTNIELSRLNLPLSQIYRPAEGSITNAQIEEFAKNGLVIVNWSIDTIDWQRPKSSEIHRRVVDNAYPGAIVLMHSAGGNRSRTVEALPGMIAALQEKGFAFVTTSEILGLQNQQKENKIPQTILAQGK